MKIREIIRFNEGIFFDGAVQADWFYNKEKADIVASNYVFHGKEYFGENEKSIGEHHIVDTITFTNTFVAKVFDDDEGVNPFTLAIAGYGSGKSHLAVTLAQLLSDTDKNCTHKIIHNIEKIDRTAAKEISSHLKQRNFVLTINGMNDFNLNYEILKSAKRSLDLYGLDDEFLVSISSACETARKFAERNFEKNVTSFESAAHRHGVSLQGEELYQFILQELGYDDTIYDIVNEVYNNLTGHEIRWDQGISAGKILETLCNEYCVSRGVFNKIVIIFDEFGRYLEYASAYSAKAGDSALQQIFEAAQNTNGLVQFLGFIQSDIKTYLSRVDQSTNISRYISRYDHSDKIHLSSNLETIFANIIERPDLQSFQKYISSRILQGSEELYKSIHRWVPNIQQKGAWSNLETFQKVICEGIYPFHALTTYLLSSMSDWLQNRSSLVLLNTNIKKYEEYNVEDEIPLIHAVDILDNELFLEILNAEEEGRQRSRFATIYDNIIKRYNTRLQENEIKVLKANLIIKICRFVAGSREDIIDLIKACTNLGSTEINDALQYLEVEYAVLSYDERANSFEFVEDSFGASDFRACMRRKKNSTTCNYDLLSNAELLQLLNTSLPIPTDYGTKNNITTSEWQFEQKLYVISDFTEKTFEKLKADCLTRYSVDKPKGLLIWLYINKEFNHEEIERVKGIIERQLTEKMPIKIFLLDDCSNDMFNYLIDYTVVSEFKDDEVVKYGVYFEDFKQKLIRNMEDCIQELKDERKLLTKAGIVTDGIPRLKIYLTKVLADIFPKVIPFSFDGFQSKAATITKSRKQLISIAKLIASDVENYMSIKVQQPEVQRKFDVLLSGKGIMSWKTITPNGKIVIPGNEKVEYVYNEVLKKLDDNGELDLGEVIKDLRNEPFGINDYAISMFLAVFGSMQRERIKFIVGEQRFSLAKWSEEVFKETSIDVDRMMDTKVIVVDSLDVRKKFNQLFDQVTANTNIAKVDVLSKELESYLSEEELPKDLEAALTLAKLRIKSGNQNKNEYNETIGTLMETWERYKEKKNLMPLIEMAEKYQIVSTVLSDNYILTEEQIEKIERYHQLFLKQINENYLIWSEKSLRCREVGSVNAFVNYTKKIIVLLENLGFNDYARKTRDILEHERSNVEVIRERQMISGNIKEFMGKSHPTTRTSLIVMGNWLQEIKRLRRVLDENTSVNKYERGELLDKLQEREVLINESISNIKNQVNAIWDLVYEVNSNDILNLILTKINNVIEIELPEADVNDLLGLQNFIKAYLEVDNIYGAYQDNREEIEKIHVQIIEKFVTEDAAFDISIAIENRYQSLKNDLDSKEKVWITRFIQCELDSEDKLEAWMRDTQIKPQYLSKKTLEKYIEKSKAVERELKKYKVRYIMSLIDELDYADAKELLDALIEKYGF